MNHSIFTYIFASLISFSNAYAGEKIKVETSELKIMGKGIVDRKTNEKLVLACENECKSLRFVYIDQTGDAYYVGDSMLNPSAPTNKLEEKAIKLKVREYMATHETQLVLERKGHYVKEVTMLMAVGTSIVAFGGIFSPVVTAIIVFGGNGALCEILFSDRLMNSFTSGMILDARITDQKGWNWSLNPKVVSDGKFKLILSQLLTDSPLISQNEMVTIKRQKRRLTNRGVKFK